MELILHYGMHKTGSSSIQNTLYQGLYNEELAYIQFGGANSSLWITQGFNKRWPKKPAFALQKISRKEVKKRTAQSRDEIIKKISCIKAKKAVLSAEAIAHLAPEETSDLIETLMPFASSIRAIGYVRAPKSYAESVFQERIKRAPIGIKKPLGLIPYRSMIEGLDEALGRDNVEVCKFDRKALRDGCVVKDFCFRAGIEVPYGSIVSSNKGLSRPAVQLLYLLWKYYPNLKFPRISKIRAFFMKFSGLDVAAHIDREALEIAVERVSEFHGDKMRLHSDAYRRLVVVNQADLEWLDQRAGIVFDEDIYAYDETGIKDEGDLIRLAPSTVQLLLEKLEMDTSSVPRLMEDHKLLARHIHMLVHQF